MQKKEVKGKILLKNGEVADPDSGEIETKDILISEGIISKVEEEIETEKAERTLDLSGMTVSPGFVDMHVHLREPGQEDAETIQSGARAALAGGFTRVCCMPNTTPPISTEGDVSFIKNKAEKVDIEVHPIATVTKQREGEELTEFSALVEAGAVGFSDDGSPVTSARVMRNALEYSRIVDKPIINHAEDQQLKNNGIINEGEVSAQTGLKGNPPIAEEIMVQRDLKLAEFTNSRIHIPHVTTKGAVEMIRKAKERGVKVTAEATPHHLTLTEKYIKSFDTRGKVAPPLRKEEDRKALIEGLKNGTIDIIATDHAPHTYNKKETTLDLAASGMIGLESAFGLIMNELVKSGEMTLLELLKKITYNPAKILGQDLGGVKEGEEAELTIFDKDGWWVFNEENVYSRSQNTPFFGKEMVGRVKKVVIGNKIIKI